MNLRQMLEVILRRKQEVAAAAAIPAGQPTIREYGCCLCQRMRKERYYHRQGLDAEYEDHLLYQSKHGTRERIATPNEVLQLLRRGHLAAKGGAA